MTATLTVIVGLPGSGKSHLMNVLKKKTTGLVADDFFKEIASGSPVLRDPTITDSYLYPRLIKDLRKGKSCVISDIIFCDTLVRAELELAVRNDVRNVRIVWEYFENSPKQCLRNVSKRKRPSLKRESQLIKFLSRKYFVPEGIKGRKVWDS